MTRAEHIAWVKQRALAELNGRPGSEARALASFASDLGKHPDTRRHDAIQLAHKLAYAGHLQTEAQVREFVDGIQ